MFTPPGTPGHTRSTVRLGAEPTPAPARRRRPAPITRGTRRHAAGTVTRRHPGRSLCRPAGTSSPANRNAGELRASRVCQGWLAECRCRLGVLADRSGDLGDPLTGYGFAGRVLVPAAERGFDPAGADAGPARPMSPAAPTSGGTARPRTGGCSRPPGAALSRTRPTAPSGPRPARRPSLLRSAGRRSAAVPTTCGTRRCRCG